MVPRTAEHTGNRLYGHQVVTIRSIEFTQMIAPAVSSAEASNEKIDYVYMRKNRG
jgi:hypothetical protein